MEDRSSLTSFLTSSLRAPFRNRRSQASEDSGSLANHDAPKASYQRRRHQVRQAQKKHREKKENYIAALEEETQRLRRALHESQLENCAIRQVIGSQGLSISDPSMLTPPGGHLARVAFVGSPGSDQSLQIQSTVQAGFQQPVPVASATSTSFDQDGTTNVEASGQPDFGEHASPNFGASSPTASSLGDTRAEFAGFQFVLALEHPCLHHTGHPSITSGMPGHALTLNAAALSCAPIHVGPAEVWSVPTASLSRLLELSGTLGLNFGTLTPIQAWQRVLNHPNFPNLTPDKFQELIDHLSKEVKCHGFGAAMNEKALEVTLRRLFK